MQELKNKIASTAEHVEDYLKVEEQLLRLRVIRSASKGIAVGVSLVVLIVSGFIALIFLSMGIAWLINDWADNTYIGHIIVGGCYLLLGCIVWFGRNKVVLAPVSRAIINGMLDDKNEEDEDDSTEKGN
jgi:protein-S-isoprenylcysteine O-methyltransferase Ste14